MQLSNCFKPIAAWSGRLILPRADQRREDGGVLIEVLNAPQPHQALIGKTVALAFHENSNPAEWQHEVSTDIVFNEQTLQGKAEKRVLPERLNGWSQVSPLETLSGTRPLDDVFVQLKRVEVSPHKDLLKIFEAPVQVCGRAKALVRFTGGVDAQQRRIEVVHYNPTTKHFDGPTQWMHHLPSNQRHDIEKPQVTLEQIDRSSFNQLGWYVFGTWNDQGDFTIHGLEPRSLLLVQVKDYRPGLQATDHFIDYGSWNECYRGHSSQTLLDANSVLTQKLPTDQTLDSRIAETFVEGTRCLLLHVFGWIKTDTPDSFIKAGIVMGHFSLGTAEVVRDSFTGELRWDIEYLQVYVQNVEGIVSGAAKWHNYMGSLRRGWLTLIPVSDIIVYHPALNHTYQFENFEFHPLTLFQYHAYRVMARIRHGEGTGLTMVNLATSCVQDAALALYACVKEIQGLLANNEDIDWWLQKNRRHPQTELIEQLLSLTQSLNRFFKPFGVVPARWALHEKRIPFRLPIPHLTQFVDALLTHKTILPRVAHDGLAKVFAREGGLLWVLRTDQVGGVRQGNEPLWPTTFKIRHPAKWRWPV